MADQDLNFNIAISTQKRTEQGQVSTPPPKPEINNQSNNENQEDQQQEGGGFSQMIKNAAHPGVCLFSIGFKIAALVSFILLDLFTKEALTYLVVIIIGSVDFYMTKNIAGRILVGLRWWNEVKEDGSEVWIFESKNESKIYIFYFLNLEKESGADSTIFWSSLYINAAAWLALFIWELIRLKFVWAFIAFICLVFGATNVYGYVKCSKDQQSNLLKLGAKTVMKAAEKGAGIAKPQA